MADQEEMITAQGPDGRRYTYPKSQQAQAEKALAEEFKANELKTATPERMAQIAGAPPPVKPPLPASLQTGINTMRSIDQGPQATGPLGWLKNASALPGRGILQMAKSVPEFADPGDHGIQRGVKDVVQGSLKAVTPAAGPLLAEEIPAVAAEGYAAGKIPGLISSVGKFGGKMGLLGGLQAGSEWAGKNLGKALGYAPETQEMMGALGEAAPIAAMIPEGSREWMGEAANKIGRGAWKVATSPEMQAAIGTGLAHSFGVPPMVSDIIGAGLEVAGLRYKPRSSLIMKALEAGGRAWRGEGLEVKPPTKAKAPEVKPPGEKPSPKTVDEKISAMSPEQRIIHGREAIQLSQKIAGGAKGAGEVTPERIAQAEKTAKSERLARHLAINEDDLGSVAAKAKNYEYRKALGKASGLKYVPSEKTIQAAAQQAPDLKKRISEKLHEIGIEMFNRSPDVITSPVIGGGEEQPPPPRIRRP